MLTSKKQNVNHDHNYVAGTFYASAADGNSFESFLYKDLAFVTKFTPKLCHRPVICLFTATISVDTPFTLVPRQFAAITQQFSRRIARTDLQQHAVEELRPCDDKHHAEYRHQPTDDHSRPLLITFRLAFHVQIALFSSVYRFFIQFSLSRRPSRRLHGKHAIYL